MSDSANIARHLPLMAARQPDHPALKIPRGRTPAGAIDYLALSFAELDAEVNAWCARLQKSGVRRGDRTLIMVKQGLPLIAAVFALFKLGAVPIVIDPGMGLKNFLRCVARSRPRAIIGIPMARFLSRLFNHTFASVRIRIPARNSLTARLTPTGDPTPRRPAPAPPPPVECHLLSDIPEVNPAHDECHLIGDIFPVASVSSGELAAILFTSGSTGAPKGVCYTHGMFEAQVRLIRDHYGIQSGEIDLPMLPIFALFNPALGMATVVPEIDPRRPAAVDPEKIVRAILQEGVTNSFGSPTLWRKIQAHCMAQNIALPTLRRVLCAGAPVPAALWENPARWLPNGTLHSPYGATEALPISSVSDREIEILKSKIENCPGACVGRPLPGIDVRIIALTDAPIATLADAEELPCGEIGEIIVHGPVVTQTYDALPLATAAAKISNSESTIENDSWHRMGDCGYCDADGKLWFVGRKVERVQTAAGPIFTEPCEQVFRTHPRAARCALIGLGPPGAQRPALVAETQVQNSADARSLARELRQLALTQPHTTPVRTFFFRAPLPVDVRHNAKIHRLALASWAGTAKGYTSDPKR